MNPLNDQQIIDSWQKNAAPWTTAVRENHIESRTLVTNQAIVDAVLAIGPKTVLDIGCGEGWLARELATHSIRVLGLDVVSELVEQACKTGGGRFEVMSYEDLAAGKLTERFDAAVCNFSLLGKESVDGIFNIMPTLLHTGGYFIVQTIHPVMSCGDQVYQDGWREGSWHGFSNDFTDPAPWYFRTIESWVRMFHEHHFHLTEIREPMNPYTGKPASIVLVGRLNN
ncbi:MAG: class I SAM-dependent methyltransferase [Chloroflexi bacterium AL-W]|nr:class I SAM-dependent methyltransferase [Chloroflexi bacterium AL-W]